MLSQAIIDATPDKDYPDLNLSAQALDDKDILTLAVLAGSNEKDGELYVRTAAALSLFKDNSSDPSYLYIQPLVKDFDEQYTVCGIKNNSVESLLNFMLYSKVMGQGQDDVKDMSREERAEYVIDNMRMINHITSYVFTPLEIE